MNQVQEDQIKATPCPNDPIFNQPGEILYSDIQDRLFDVPGKWQIRHNAQNSMLWLDPRPAPQSLHLLYKNYDFTHSDNTKISSISHYGKFIPWLYQHTVGFLPYIKRRTELDAMLLKQGNGKHVLDIGCGNGERLNILKNMGWIPTGVEFDPQAVQFSKIKYNLKIHMGTLEEVDWGDSKFDAIILSHVIEHLWSPVETLKKCHNLLNPNGTLTLVTPNIESLGHTTYKQNCFHLEPPRHLQIFSTQSIELLVQTAGFQNFCVTTSPLRAQSVSAGSLDIKNGFLPPKVSLRKIARDCQALAFQWKALVYHKRHPNSGEEIILQAQK